MVSRLVEIYSNLEEPEFRILRNIEKNMKKYEYVPIELIEKESKLPPSKLSNCLRKLSTFKLVKRVFGNIIGFTLTYLGLDILALRGLMVRGVIKELGDKIGAGKEGDVYIGITPGYEKITIKFHREGSAPFRKIKRTRSFVINMNWRSMIELAKALSEREFEILTKLYNKDARVPIPIARNRHAIVMKYIEDSIELYKRPELNKKEAIDILTQVLKTLRVAYIDVGIIHGDLSEYNVLVRIPISVNDTAEAYVIDWSQYIYKDEPHAEELLKRDIQYITRFFRKIYRIEVDGNEALKYVKGNMNELSIE